MADSTITVTVKLTTADKLALFLQACAGTPFSWATWNCFHFAAAWVLVATGRTIEAGLPGVQGHPGVDGPRAWAIALHAAGGMLRHASARLGTSWRPAERAEPGDLVTLPGRLVPAALGIHAGDRIACVGAPAGVAWQPLAAATACWRLQDIIAAAEVSG